MVVQALRDAGSVDESLLPHLSPIESILLYNHAMSKDESASSDQQSGDSGQAASGSEQSEGGSQEQGQDEGNPAAGVTPLWTIRGNKASDSAPKPGSAPADQGQDTGSKGENKGNSD